MSKNLTCSIMLSTALGLAAPAVAQEGEMPPEMAAYMKYAAPGEHHAHLKAMEGTWNVKTTAWMAPEAPPMESTGKSVNTSMLGGRFLGQEYTGDMMGQPFVGMGALGYDNYKQKYVSTWIDNMGTMMYHGEGSCTEGGKQIVFMGEYEDPVTESMHTMKTEYTIEGADKHVMRMYDKGPEGPERKTLEIVYTRVQ